MSRIIFQDSYIIVLPSFHSVKVHTHPMLHLFMSRQECEVIVEDKPVRGRAIFLDSNVKHILPQGNHCEMFLLIDPTSILSSQIKDRYLKNQRFCSLVETGWKLPENILRMTDEETVSEVEKALTAFQIVFDRCEACDPRIEELKKRISRVEYLNQSIGEIAKDFFLSESRLTHLFKQEKGIALRSYILIRQMEQAYRLVLLGENITDAAMKAGFCSSAHLALTCKKLTGISISDVLKR